MRDTSAVQNLAVYIHIPFCLSKCTYCDFLSFKGKRETIAAYIQHLFREIELYHSLLSQREVKTIYFGGGTPSLLTSTTLRKLLHSISPLAREVTLEANPGTVSQAQLERLRDSGFNRVSLGIQSFLDRELRLLGRIHNAREGEKAIISARRAGFDNINCDLIFGLPGQSLEDFLFSLQGLLLHGPEHISLYSLSLSQSTPLGMMVQAGKVGLPSEDETAEMYERATSLLKTNGYEHYEISNFARPGKCSLHNQSYWHGQDYLGLGLGAVSFLNGTRFQNVRNLGLYFKHIERKERPVSRTLKKKGSKALKEEVILHLRTSEGFHESNLAQKYGRIFPAFKKRLLSLKNCGLLQENMGHWWLPEKHFFVSNEVFLRLL